MSIFPCVYIMCYVLYVCYVLCVCVVFCVFSIFWGHLGHFGVILGSFPFWAIFSFFFFFLGSWHLLDGLGWDFGTWDLALGASLHLIYQLRQYNSLIHLCPNFFSSLEHPTRILVPLEFSLRITHVSHQRA